MSPIVAVTGADGFIGSHLVRALVERGQRVRAMALYNSFGTWGWLDSLPEDIMAEVDVVPGDVRDSGCVLTFCKDAECVYHLAALIAIPYSYQAPRSYVDTNVTGTLNVLEAVRRLEIPRMVHTSTSETYGTARTVPISENHPIQAQSPYAASKVAADKLAESYHLSFGVPVVTLRPFNTYGPRQSARAVIPTVVSQIAAGAEEILLGSLEPTRDFNYATDTADAFITVGTAGEAGIVGEAFNAGSGTEISIKDLAVTIGRVMGRQIEVKQDPQRLRPRGSEVMRLVADNSRLTAVTPWRPRVDLETGLDRTAEWFTEPSNLARYKTDIYNV